MALPVLAACGEDAPAPEPEPAKTEAPPAIRMTFALDVAAAIESGALPADTDPGAVLTETVRTVGERLRIAEATGAVVQAAGDGRFQVDLPEALRERRVELQDLLTTFGRLDFRIQVLPLPNEHDEGKRKSSWAGTEEEFNAWKQAEFERMQKLEQAGKAYLPSTDPNARPCYLVRRQEREGATLDDYEVVEVPAAEDRFDGTMFEAARVTRDMSGIPAVLFEVKASRQEAFHRWTEQNVGLCMAILVNGEFKGEGRAPTIQSPLRDSVQITLGSIRYAEAERRAQAMATAIQSGALKVLPTLESVEDLAKDGSD